MTKQGLSTELTCTGSRVMKRRVLHSSLVVAAIFTGCVHVKTDPIEVKPIHITVDVNVKVDKALDDFFGDLDKKSETIATPGAKS